MKKKLLIALMGLLAVGCGAQSDEADADNVSVYGPESAGMTASGEVFDWTDRTAAAAPLYPMGSTLEVCYDGCTQVRVNDATPYTDTFDISWAAGEDIGLVPDVGRCDCSVTLVS